ncbi:von Willebrand factor A domain-containing protein 3A isoform X3 [Hyla sarda]|uniref:von Willebrand factor A domain-containing protein 3A isoform X2 n=1 Tax=Hyla sarda TaxID=327740 RepID=UPI0024C2371C|nr:von Willebrand factor A domain-containing protein 3A isoform X2 [Hyla sarda]XP_056390760.1 von Willebrand factor A domain-containing protein 3A isoform X3 [Hyla sarda]
MYDQMDTYTDNMALILENEQFFKTSYQEPEDALIPVPFRARTSWQDENIKMKNDSSLLMTSNDQTQRLAATETGLNDAQCSEEWVLHHGIDSQHLTIQDLLKLGNIVMKPSKNAAKQIELTAETVHGFEMKIQEAIDFFHKRIRWLMEGSRKMFGLVQGKNIGLLIDSSHLNCGPRRMDFLRGLLCLVDEQLCYKKKIFLMSFGTEVSCPWEYPQNVNVRVLHEARQWIQEMQPRGGCNLLLSLRKALQIQDLDTLVVIVSNSPDQTSDVLSDYLLQCTLGKNLKIHIVAVDSIGQADIQALAEAVGAHFHCFSSWKEDEIYASTDIKLVFKEVQKAIKVLNKIKELRQGKLDDTCISIIQEISTEVAKIPTSAFLPKPPNHSAPLNVDIPNFSPRTSAEWLKKNGLKAKKMTLYQILAPNAYSTLEEFVPILQKTVSSTLLERAMMQFEWHDGTVKNIHVDPPVLYEYQKQLAKMARNYEKRIDWLTKGSRRLWGTVCEKRVVLLVDLSLENALHIIHIQHSLRLVLEEQMANKDLFNIIVFGGDVHFWKEGMVPTTSENLQSAWKWVLTLECEGSRNVLGAIKRAIECNFIDKENQESQGMYLFTSGIPDQEMNTVLSYLSEAVAGCNLQLHVCFSTSNEDSDNDNRDTAHVVQELAHVTGGRFHWFDDTGVIESDDISALVSEMEKAVNYSKKCAYLVESLKYRTGSKDEGPTPEDAPVISYQKEKQKPKKLPLPKPTALTLARMGIKDDEEEKKNANMKALMWRPNSAKADIPPAHPFKDWGFTNDKKVKQKKLQKPSISSFYTENGKGIGVVYKDYPKTKTVRKSIPFIVLPKEEEACSTKAWLKKFGLKKLKLELTKLVFGPDCNHQKKLVPALHKKVSAKYCTIFPSVEINGVVKHLQFQPKELEEYIEQLEKTLKRYIQRLQWLLSGSRRLFGTIVENKVCILIDASSSMAPFLAELQKGLISLLWEQLRPRNIGFNMISITENIEPWQECLVEASDEACRDAVQWLSRIQPQGNTCILHALEKGFAYPDVQGVYLLTDGKPDISYNLMLAEHLVKSHNIKVHTVTFNTSERPGNEFLKKLASLSGGRYHSQHGDMDGHFAAHRMLTEGFTDEDDPVLPVFEGDDLKILAKEIDKARRFVTQARSFQSLILEKQMSASRDASMEGSDISDERHRIPAEKVT